MSQVVPTAPDARPDPLGDLDPEIARYTWALRRSIWVIGAAAVAGAVLGSALIGGSSYTTVQNVSVVGANDVLASNGLDQAFDDTPPLFVVRDYFNEPSAIDADDVAVAAVIDPTTNEGVVLTVTGPDQDTTTAATDALLAGLSDSIGEVRERAAADLIGVIDDQRAAVVARRDDLDVEIASLADSSALRDAYLDERASLTNSLLAYDSQENALRTFATSDRRIEVNNSLDEESNSRGLWLVVGAILGALIATAVTLVAAHLDRRVRSRADLRRIVDVEVLPAIVRSGPELELAESAAGAAIARLAGGRSIAVLPVDAASQGVAERLVARCSGDARVVPLADVATIAPGSAVVLAAAAGGTHADDVARASLYVDANGLTSVGAVLGDVKPSQLRHAAI